MATVPNYCTLLVTGSDDVEGLERLASLSIQEFAKGKSITAVPLRFSGGTWTPFMPPEGHPHHNAFRRLELISLHTEYQEQSELLQQLKNATGDSALASGYELIRDTVTGKVSSLSRWPLGTELLVPITDVIEFVREGKDNEGREILGHTSWDRFQQMMGDELEPTNFYPPRFRIKVPAIKA